MATQGYFDKNAANFDKRSKEREQMKKDFAEKLVKNVLIGQKSQEFKKISVMDFGTGTGNFGIEVVKRLQAENAVHHATFADLSSEMLKKCAKNAEVEGIMQPDKGCNCEFVQLDSNKDFPEKVMEKFDVVMSIMAFHHFLKPKESMKRLLETCKKNGQLYVLDIKLTEDSKYFHPESIKKECNYEGNLDGFELEAFGKDMLDVGFSNIAIDEFKFTRDSEKEAGTGMVPVEYSMFVMSGQRV